MTLPRMQFTVRDVMIANLAVGILLAWIVCWEQHRVRYGSPQGAMEGNYRVAETARLWADEWPSGDVIASGLIVDLWVVGLTLAISKAVTLKVRQARRSLGYRQKQ